MPPGHLSLFVFAEVMPVPVSDPSLHRPRYDHVFAGLTSRAATRWILGFMLSLTMPGCSPDCNTIKARSNLLQWPASLAGNVM